MKPLLFLTISLIACVSSLHSQSIPMKQASANASNMFVELGANGGFLSVNYDTRFSKSGKGLGARIGIGYIPSFDVFYAEIPTILTIPIGLNYLMGKGSHYFESGVGATIATARSELFGDEGQSDTGIALVPSVGYRYQPQKKGFTGRIVLSPFIGGGDFQFWAGISGGIRF